MRWKVTRKVKKIDVRDELTPGLRGNEVRDTLLVFAAVEGIDQEDQEKVVEEAKKVIEQDARQMKVENIVLYAFVHLFPESLPKAEFAMETMQKLEKTLKRNFNVYRVPFGWYKMHEYKCLGHPLSELSRTIRP